MRGLLPLIGLVIGSLLAVWLLLRIALPSNASRRRKAALAKILQRSTPELIHFLRNGPVFAQSAREPYVVRMIAIIDARQWAEALATWDVFRRDFLRARRYSPDRQGGMAGVHLPELLDDLRAVVVELSRR